MSDFKKEMEELGLDYDPNETIELNNNVDVDIVLSDKKKINLKFLLIIPLILCAFLIVYGSIILSQNKIVAAPVIGANTNIGDICIVSDNYNVSASDIKVGSKILFGDRSESYIGPILINYQEGEVQELNDLVLYVKLSNSDDVVKISLYDVLYIIN